MSIISSIAKVSQSISSIQKVGVGSSLGLSFSLALSKIRISQSMSIVSSIAKVSQSISTISSIQEVGVSISLGLGLGLSKGNSGQKGNSNGLHHLASPTSDQQRISQ